MILESKFYNDVLFNKYLTSTSKLLWYFIAHNGQVIEFDDKIYIRSFFDYGIWSYNLNISIRQCYRCFTELLSNGLCFVKEDEIRGKYVYIEIPNKKAD